MTNYKRIRALFPDHLGLARGKYLPAAVAANGARHCTALFALAFDRTMVPAPGSKLLEGLPDFDLKFSMDEVRPGWEPDTGVVVGDAFYHGEPLRHAPRSVLRKAIADWEALGYQPIVGIELEAFVMQPDGRGGWTEWHTPTAYVYGTGHAVDPVGLFDEIMATADRCGLPIESINSEYDTPQFEMTLVHDHALRAVDNIFLFKLMAREIAAKHGLLLTFIGKPFADRGGSGLHVNFSLRDKYGHNAMADPEAPDGLSKLAHQCIAGLIAHHEGMTALCAPTVNAYKRLKPAQLAGFWANWGYDHRGVTVRIPHERGKATRIEHRMPDGAASPYYATAAVLQAARLGVVNNLTPPPAEEQDCLEHQSTNRHTPTNLSAALEALEADKEFVEAFSPESVAQFVATKRAEWEKFAYAVTDWELKYYLPFL
ncbi:MAG: glutamine synthetase family protein [Thermoflexales bacterium]|nr:glutamine synthetase family protein [Thermoflexales bacterium]MDW8351899.1 glutamine synthetase family protein [Anaerolineae bacterium]